MVTDGVPLRGFEAFRARSRDELSAAVEDMGARLLALGTPPELSAVANSVRLPNGELWFCSYGTSVRLGFGESDYFRLQVPVSGTGRTSFDQHAVEVGGSRACISSAAAVIDFFPGFQQIAWRVHRAALVRKLNARLDRRLTQPLEFRPALEIDSSTGQSLAHIVRCILQVIATGTPAQSLIVEELEQALMSGLLYASDHNLRQALEKRPLQAAPSHVRLAEEFIHANWDRPLSIDEIAAAAHVSVRSLYRAFRTKRGIGPMEFLKQCRLAQAHAMLKDSPAHGGVTAVAMACGFGDLSHFSKEFSKAFGEAPSAVARRRNQLRRC